MEDLPTHQATDTTEFILHIGHVGGLFDDGYPAISPIGESLVTSIEGEIVLAYLNLPNQKENYTKAPIKLPLRKESKLI